jgi:hypothetical protein
MGCAAFRCGGGAVASSSGKRPGDRRCEIGPRIGPEDGSRSGAALLEAPCLPRCSVGLSSGFRSTLSRAGESPGLTMPRRRSMRRWGSVVSGGPNRCQGVDAPQLRWTPAVKRPRHAARDKTSVRPVSGSPHPRPRSAGHGRRRGFWVLAPRTIRACRLPRRQAVTALGFVLLQGCGHRRVSGAPRPGDPRGDAATHARGSRVTRRPPRAASAARHPLLAFLGGPFDRPPPSEGGAWVPAAAGLQRLEGAGALAIPAASSPARRTAPSLLEVPHRPSEMLSGTACRKSRLPVP